MVAELGGKNCIIVASDADLDEAVPAIVGSAFNYAGQKCSAASRVLAHEAIADQLLERLAGAVRTLVVGQAETLGTDVPPVIEREAQERVAALRAGGAETAGGSSPRPSAPTAAAGSARRRWPPTSRTARPCSRRRSSGRCSRSSACATSTHACDVVDGLAYALTGGLFTRDPGIVRRVRRRSPVGNLYVNRGITGAMVARQPFGGNRLSGTGLKAGGPDYLLQFVEQRAVSENTMRHGLEV